MDDAWIGLIGAGLGVAGTTLVAGVTQWRAEVQRAKDREAEAQRSRDERDEAAQRWDRERRTGREDERRAHWDNERRAASEEFIWAALSWYEAITRAGVHTEHNHEAPSRPGAPEAARAYEAERRLILLGSYELRDQARRVIVRHEEASGAAMNPALDPGARRRALDDAGPAFLAFVEMARIELGIVDAEDLNRVFTRVRKDASDDGQPSGGESSFRNESHAEGPRR